MLASLPPEALVSLPLAGCTAALLFDRIETTTSSRRLAKAANQKTPARLAIEDPLGTAALLSLAGVRTVLLNQWATSATEANSEAMRLLTKLGSGATLAKALADGRKELVGDALPETPREMTPRPPEPEPAKPPSRGGKGGKGRAASPKVKPRPPQKEEARPGSTEGPLGSGTPGSRVGRLDVAKTKEKPLVPWGPLANAVVFGIPTFKLGN
jgi:hypothetical protein